jgi:tRNA pseudouridine13 synthase
MFDGRFAGTGGTIKETPGDFLVCEIPFICLAGRVSILRGNRKDGITTLEAIREWRALSNSGRVSYAGMKDAGGITRQTISIPRVAPELIMNAEILESGCCPRCATGTN